jgi:hypothetical protein
MWKKVCKEAERNKMYGFEVRMSQIANMKSEVSLDIANLVVSTFTLIYRKELQPESVLYAFVYSEQVNGELIPKYFCANPSFESKDGEYRPKIGRYENLSILKTTYPDIMDEINAYLTTKKGRMSWDISINHFSSGVNTTRKYSKLLEGVLSDELLAIIWFNCVYNRFYGMIEVHANEKFNRVLGLTGSSLARDTNFYQKLRETYGNDKLRHFRQLQDYFYVNPTLDKSFRLGQKIIPLSVIEAERAYSIGYKPWREMLVTNKLGDLVVNRICPGFPMTVMSFYIQQGHHNLFDNTAQVIRTQLSEQATGIVKELSDAKAIAMTASKSINIEDEVLQEWANDKLKSMDDMLDDAIAFGKKEMILSNVALCMFSEFMGKTLHNAIESAMRSDVYNAYIGNFLGSHDTFSKFMFEFFNAFLAANYYCGIIHSDVHMNNACIHPTYSNTQRSPHEGSQIAYDISDPNNGEGTGMMFKFPSTQYSGCIIDFSRCVIKINMLNQYINSDLEYAQEHKLEGIVGVSDVGSLMIYSLCRMRYLYKQYLPEFYSANTLIVEVILREHFLDVFHLLTAFDPLMLSLKLREFMQRSDNKSKFDSAAYAKNIKLLNNIIDQCKVMLTHDILGLVRSIEKIHGNKPGGKFIHTYKPMEDSGSTMIFMQKSKEETVEWKELLPSPKLMEYPIYKIFERYFASFTLKDETGVFDQYSLARRCVYSLDSYDSLPPEMKTPTLRKSYKQIMHTRHHNMTVINHEANVHSKLF